MSTTQETNGVLKESKKPFSPTRDEILGLYPDSRPSYLKNIFAFVRKEFPSRFKTKNLTNKQFIEFIREVGLPTGFKKNDLHFLEGVDIFE